MSRRLSAIVIVMSMTTEAARPRLSEPMPAPPDRRRGRRLVAELAEGHTAIGFADEHHVTGLCPRRSMSCQMVSPSVAAPPRTPGPCCASTISPRTAADASVAGPTNRSRIRARRRTCVFRQIRPRDGRHPRVEALCSARATSPSMTTTGSHRRWNVNSEGPVSRSRDGASRASEGRVTITASSVKMVEIAEPSHRRRGSSEPSGPRAEIGDSC
jgi:hypothetical protein